jgi:hypothetical protein
VNRLVNCTWRIDYIFSSSEIESLNETMVNLKLTIDDTKTNCQKSHVLSLNSEKVKLLLYGNNRLNNYTHTHFMAT